MSGMNNLSIGSRIRHTFTTLEKGGEKALISFVMAGDPDWHTTVALVKTLVKAGSDLVEIGLPFSDPLADGPIIQRASQRALAHGITPPAVLELVAHLRRQVNVPLILLSYANPLLRMGISSFAQRAATVGLDGVIVPDMPLEESPSLRSALGEHSVDLIPMLAPTSTAARLHQAVSLAPSFIYCVAVTGVTGTKKDMTPEMEGLMHNLRAATDIPLAVGFGVNSAAQARDYARQADGIIVGSAIVELMERYGKDGLHAVGELVRELKEALTSSGIPQG